MYSHQQVLHAIVSDGQRMRRSGEVEDPKEFERKLSLLSEQWQSVTRRATQRKNLIDSTIQDWHLFNSLSTQLRTWLGEKELIMKTFEGDRLSLQQIRNHLDKVKVRIWIRYKDEINIKHEQLFILINCLCFSSDFATCFENWHSLRYL